MSEGLSVERVTARVAEGAVQFSFPDGTSTSAPASIVSRSALLRDALETDSAELSICLPAPEGLLSSWLQLQMSMSMNSDALPGQASSDEPLQHAHAGLLSKYLKVSLHLCILLVNSSFCMPLGCRTYWPCLPSVEVGVYVVCTGSYKDLRSVFHLNCRLLSGVSVCSSVKSDACDTIVPMCTPASLPGPGLVT